MIPDLPTPYGVSMEVLNRYLKSLYDANWEDPHGPIRLDSNITLAEMARAEIFINTRIFLNALQEDDGAPMTVRGNLTRSFVRRMFDQMHFEPGYRERKLRVCKVLNEPDVGSLREIRALAEFGKLVVGRNERIVITMLGCELLADGRAGELFRRLFLTFFRTVDLTCMVYVREVPEIQTTLAITLWRLGQVAENWRAVKGVAAQILPPRVLKHLVSQQRGDFDDPDYFVAAYVLQPLREFGLLERQLESDRRVAGKDTVRVTPLFRRFISFAEIPSPMNN